MNKRFSFSLALAFTVIIAHAQTKQPADLLVYNANVYTVNNSFAVEEAIAVKGGKILAVGKSQKLLSAFDAKEKIDAKGKFIYPGFIDAHAHFIEYGTSLQTADLTGTKSWEEILERLKSFAATHPDGWLRGHGWDQNDWPVKEFPVNDKLDELFPDRPVVLERVDGHALIANKKAMGDIPADTKVEGGELIVKDGKLTGLLVDNAVNLVASKIPSPTIPEYVKSTLQAQANCFAVGLTTVDDCGLPYYAIELIESLQKTGRLKMRMYVMLRDDENSYNRLFQRGRIKTDRLNVRAFKIYVDGALGSRGACLIKPYTDKPGSHGFLINSIEHYDSVAAIIYEHGFQMCTHAIGDSGNRVVLNTYGKYLKGKNDLRWRIEHAQVVAPEDFDLFGKYSIVPSVQPTHATSDMYWAADRLGNERVKGAYAYKQLMSENGWIPLGTDFPVEDISPFKTFYAATVRKDSSGFPAAGFQIENALTRQEALKGMTTWAAKANFEEDEKGSLEKGKFADFIILDQDIMKVEANKILQTKVLQTFVGGEKVYSVTN